MKRFLMFVNASVLALMFVTATAKAEVPKSCQELSSMVLGKIVNYYSRSSKTLVSMNVPMLSICASGKPMPAYNFDCTSCGIPFNARYIDADGTCYETNMEVLYETGFSNLQVADLAMYPKECPSK
jgi:hypothetical protein